MKIGIEVQRLFRPQKFGIEIAALQLLKKFQQNFRNTEFVVYAKDDVDKQCLNFSGNFMAKTLTGKVFFDFEHVFLPLAAKNDRIDLLHCTGNTTPFFSPIPVVQTLHDVIFMDPISSSDTLYQRFGNHYRRQVVPIVTPRSAAVITVSHYEKERILKKIKMDEKNIRVIYNGIDENRFRIQDKPKNLQEIKECYHLPSRFILFLGNTAARKNAPRVIKAYCMYASRTKNPLPIITPGLPDKFIQSNLAAIGQTDKQHLFISPGYIRDEDLQTLYSLSTVFLYPSLSEGFGMPLVEAMACGAPVITSEISCLPEIAGGAASLVNPYDTSSIAEAITSLTENDVLRMNRIAQGLMNAKRFSWDTTADQVFEVYEKVFFDHNKQKVRQSPSGVALQVQ